GSTRLSLFGPDDQSSPSGQSRLNTLLLSPSQCLEHAFSPCAYPFRCAQSATRGARRFFRFVLARCRPYSCSRESVQSASDCRIRIAPPPLTPEM
ncbi:MAG: hypothetical protein ACK56F_12640, partial [bacterium]